ncbi:hypothetical protein L1987_61687 [Smallanthus sonchifolius]|uniref:Uncharacterized protein n=1 Tax=Smallanthus sonchifolius TaxID=185202 RepID=A0ACB9C8A2_9ASTR|nr:hypothetical protein L1987_61687 [Smallanthus sonchifolius]
MGYRIKPLWDVIAYTLSNVPLPAYGKKCVLFAITNSLLSVDFPPKDGLPHADDEHEERVFLIRFYIEKNPLFLLGFLSDSFCYPDPSSVTVRESPSDLVLHIRGNALIRSNHMARV